MTIVFGNMKAQSCSTNAYFVFLHSVYSAILKDKKHLISHIQKDKMMYLLLDAYNLHEDRQIKKMVSDIFTT